jgi:hypothetical protein
VPVSMSRAVVTLMVVVALAFEESVAAGNGFS